MCSLVHCFNSTSKTRQMTVLLTDLSAAVFLSLHLSLKGGSRQHSSLFLSFPLSNEVSCSLSSLQPLVKTSSLLPPPQRTSKVSFEECSQQPGCFPSSLCSKILMEPNMLSIYFSNWEASKLRSCSLLLLPAFSVSKVAAAKRTFCPCHRDAQSNTCGLNETLAHSLHHYVHNMI